MAISDLEALAKMVGLPGAFIVWMWWQTRGVSKKDDGPARALGAKLDELGREVKAVAGETVRIRERLAAVEAILEERK